ncbi:MAG TPA: hypothetical protein VG435_09875 [Acidimicrobiales bacterium]|jgi:hypothetical protein|nr:hypothetical protein [Acidimicrobiales bacterium]
MRFVLDTSCLIAAQEPADAHHVAVSELFSLGAAGRAELLVSHTSYAYDLENDTVAERRAQRLAWLDEQPLGKVPGAFTWDVSRLGHGDVWLSDEIAEQANALNRLLLDEARFSRRKAIDPHHMVAALMAGADFVTTDYSDILRRRDRISNLSGLSVMSPAEAVCKIRTSNEGPSAPGRSRGG